MAFNYQQIQGVKGNSFVTDDFIKAVEEMAARLGTKPEYVLAAMSFETGGTFNPGIQNGIGATGLIQFLKSTATGLGTTTDKLKNMSSVQQLVFVEKYFLPFKGKLATLEAVYTSILSGSPKKPDDVLFRAGTPAYKMNPLDWNQDGVITAREATTIVGARLFGGVKPVQQRLVDLGFVPDAIKDGFADGRWGKNTTDALGKFQKKAGLLQTGLMDEATGIALFGGTPSSEPTTPTTPVSALLERGSTGDAVKALQDSFVKLGYLTIEAMGGGHGTFGPLTEGAVKAFQAHIGAEVTGKFGDIEQKAINVINAGIGRDNSNIHLVKAIQGRLVEFGLLTQAQVSTGPGTFGPQTENAIKAFQAKKGLQQSGVVESATYKALFNPEGADTTADTESGTFTAKDGKNYTVAADILMTAPLEKKVAAVADAYIKQTGEKLTVTSGFRPPFRQARAMFNNLVNLGETRVRNTYKAKNLINEIIAAFNKNKGNSAAAIPAMQAVIEGQIKRGGFISNHLLSNAIDVRKSAKLSALQAAVKQVGGRIVIEKDHYHIELRMK